MSVPDTIVAAAKAKATSFRQFGRAAALVAGIAAGTIAVSNAQARKETNLKSALTTRDTKIAELEKTNAALSNPTEVASTGDPVQDWINSLE